MEKYLLTKNGKKLYRDDIKAFLEGKRKILNDIKTSPVFTTEMVSNNLDYFNSILDNLKLLTPDGQQLEDYQIKQFLEGLKMDEMTESPRRSK